MKNSKLVTRLRQLSEQEMKDFILFAESPYFNSNAALTRLLKYLQKYHPDLKGTKLAKELVYKKVFPDKAIFKEKRLNDLMSQLFKLSEDFLAFDRFKQSPVARSKQEFLSYREKGMSKDFSKAAVKLKKAIEAQPSNEEYHFELFLLNKELFIEQAEDKVNSLNAVFHHLDQYFMQEKLLFAAFAKNRERLKKESYKVNFLEDLTTNDLKKEELSLFFIRLRDILITEDISAIKNLVSEFKIRQHRLSKRLSYCVLILILNILLNKYQKNEEEVLPVIFELYKLAVTENFISFHDKINDSTFINICNVSEKVGQKEWRKDFIARYKDNIIPKLNKENTITLAQALSLVRHIKHSKDLEDIKEATIELNTLFFTNPIYTYLVRVELIKLHFSEFLIKKDDNSLEYLVSFCKKFETQLYRDYKTSHTKIQSRLNFSKSVKKLAVYIFDENEKKITEIRKEIITFRYFFAKQWLIKKLEEVIVR